MVPRIDRLWAHDTSHLDVTFCLAKLCHFTVSHLADLFRLDVEIFTDRLVLVLRIVNEFETFFVRSALFLVKETAARG